MRVLREDLAQRLFALLPRDLPESLAGRPEGCLLAARAIQAYRSGRYGEGLQIAERSLDVVRRAGATRDLCDTFGLCGYLALEIGAHARAEKFMLEQLPLAERIGSARDTSYGPLILGVVCLRQERFDEALSWLARALSGYEKLASIPYQVEIHSHLAGLHCATGELTRARESIERAARVGLPDPASQAYMLARTSTLDRIEGRASDAFGHAKRAFDLVRQHDIQEFWGVVALSYLESALAVRDSASASAALDVAEKWLEVRAERFEDLELRRCFLEDIPEHRRIRELGMTLRSDDAAHGR
jgi:tetratricopeptide (TPR) repeat protein